VQIKISKCSHDDLAVHSVTYTSMSGNRICEILNKLKITLILIALFNPDAKNPPNGPIILANKDNTRIWACNFETVNGKIEFKK
jgi:hypothetical protein